MITFIKLTTIKLDYSIMLDMFNVYGSGTNARQMRATPLGLYSDKLTLTHTLTHTLAYVPTCRARVCCRALVRLPIFIDL